MHVTVKREALLRPLAVTHRVVERRNTIPILSNLRLGTELQALTLRGTDLDIEAAAACEAEVVEPGALTLPAHILRDIVGKLPQGADVTLRAEGNGQLALTAGRARFRLPTLPVEDYPDLQAGELPHKFVVPVADIVRTIAACGFAISTEETRYYLNGVYWHAEPDGVRSERLIAVATDGHRLSRLRLPLPEGAEGMPGVILPRKLIEQLAELCKGEGAAFLDVALSPTKVRFGRDGASLTSKLIDGTFPDYKRVIPDANATVLSIDGRAVAQVLDRVSSVSSERGRAVRLDVAAEGLTLSQKNPDLGEGVEAIDATLDGKPLTIGFNGKYLKEVLDVLDSETVEVLLADPGAPTILRRRGDALHTVVLMPMRV